MGNVRPGRGTVSTQRGADVPTTGSGLVDGAAVVWVLAREIDGRQREQVRGDESDDSDDHVADGPSLHALE